MTKHTPGPWVSHKKPATFQITNDTDFPLAEVYGMSAFGSELCEANARLIAAAPDLLSLLKEATEVLAMSANNEEETPHDDDLARTCSPDDPQECLVCESRAAIAKVTAE